VELFVHTIFHVLKPNLTAEGNCFLQYLSGQKNFSVPAPPRRSNNKRAAMLPLPAAQALSQLLQQLFTLALGNTRKSGHGIRQQPDLRWFQGPGQKPVALAIVLILRDVTAYSPQFVQGGIHRPPVAPKAVLCPQETKQVPHGQGVVAVGVF